MRTGVVSTSSDRRIYRGVDTQDCANSATASERVAMERKRLVFIGAGTPPSLDHCSCLHRLERRDVHRQQYSGVPQSGQVLEQAIPVSRILHQNPVGIIAQYGYFCHSNTCKQAYNPVHWPRTVLYARKISKWLHKLADFFAELKRRRVFRVAAVYAGVAFKAVENHLILG